MTKRGNSTFSNVYTRIQTYSSNIDPNQQIKNELKINHLKIVSFFHLLGFFGCFWGGLFWVFFGNTDKFLNLNIPSKRNDEVRVGKRDMRLSLVR